MPSILRFFTPGVVVGVVCLLGLTAAPAPAQAQASTVVGISVTVLTNSNCKFTTLPGTTLAFGALNMSGAGPATAQLTAAFKCGGSAPTAVYSVTPSNGLHFGGGTRRLQHTNAVDHIPYSLVASPATGSVAKNTIVNVTITGSIALADYLDAVEGSYSDTVVISVQP